MVAKAGKIPVDFGGATGDRLAGAGFLVAAPDLVRGRLATTLEDAEKISSTIDEPHADAVALAAIDAGRHVVIHRDPGAGHWFAEPSRDAWRPEAANLAFERTVAFLREQLER